MSKIAASILAANTMHLGDAVNLILDSGCDAIHFDVMDGVFVPNISFGPAMLKDIKKEFNVRVDVHLMLANPLKYVDVFSKYGADSITVHVESDTCAQALRQIQSNGIKTGVSLKPATPAAVLQTLEFQPDIVLVMTVEPGFGGQELKPEIIQKITDIRNLGYQGDIEIDGGVSQNNAGMLVEAGAETLVLGSKYFEAKDQKALVEYIHSL